MESKYGRSTLGKVELDIPKLKEFQQQAQEMADHFKKEAEDIDVMIVTLEKRVAVLREEDRLDTDRRQERQEKREDRPQGTPFRGSGGSSSPSQGGSVPPGYSSSAKPTEPTTGTGSVSPTTPPPPPGQEHSTAEAQPGEPQAAPVDMEHSSGNDPTTEEESPRNKG